MVQPNYHNLFDWTIQTREVIWYHFTAVKWYHITSRVLFLSTALSHWYPHIMCNKSYYQQKKGATLTQKFTRCNHLRLICSKCILGWHTHKPVLRTRATGLQPLPWLLLKPSFLTTLAALGAVQVNYVMEWTVAKANHFGCNRCSASELCFEWTVAKANHFGWIRYAVQ